MAWFEGQYRVRFADVDHAGIVFFAKILEYCHWALEDMQREAGIPLEMWFSELGIGAPLVDVNVQYHHPLQHGDPIRIAMGFEKIGPRSMISRYRVLNAMDKLCAEARFTQVIINTQAFAACELPVKVAGALSAYLIE